MKKITTAIILLISSLSLISQVTNGDRYNIFVQSVGYDFDPDSQDGPNRVVFLMDAAAGTSSGACLLDRSVSGDGVAGSGYSNSRLFNLDTPFENTSSSNYQTLISGSGENANGSRYGLTWMGYEKEQGEGSDYRYYRDYDCGSFCTHDDDGYRESSCRNFNAKTGAIQGSWYYFWDRDTDNVPGYVGIRVRHAWRHYNGQGQTRPLEFETIPVGESRTHTNYNRAAPSGAHARQGYYNNWGTGAGDVFDDGRDVTYLFEVNETSLVTMSTDNATTNFDTRIHLIKKLSGVAQWEHITVGEDIDANNNKSTITYALDPGQYFVVVEGNNAATGTFKLDIDVAAANMTAGTITHPSLNIRENCSLVTPITVSPGATNSFNGNYSYQWEKKPTNGSTWEEILGATNASLTDQNLGSINETIDIRRIATSQCVSRISNVLTFENRTIGNTGYNGKIAGSVKGPGGIGAVNGAKIYAISNAEGQCTGHIDSTTTNSAGDYILDNLYYGNSGEQTLYKVYAKFLDHEIHIVNDMTRDTFEVLVSSNGERNANFIDATSIFINGQLYQVDERLANVGQDTCGIVGNQVKFINSGQLPTNTDDNGNYNLIISNRTGDNLYDVAPDTSNYQYVPNQREDVFVVDDVFGVDFENIRRDTIKGSVTACGGFYFGSVQLKIEDTWGSCFTYFVDTDVNGDFSVAVPSRTYVVSIESVNSTVPPYTSGEILQYFDGITDTVDVTSQNAEVKFVYRQPPSIAIVGMPTNTCGDKTDTIFYQGQPAPIVILITEENTGGCPMDTGILIINDQISGIDGNIEIPFSQGRAEYVINPGEPFIFDDYKKSFTVVARDIERPNNVDQVDIRCVVAGNKPREFTFTTVSPEIPLLILRDPPGDRSYAFFEEDSTYTFASNFSVEKGGAVRAYKKVNMGHTFEAGVIGFTQEFKLSKSKETSLTVAGKNVNQTESITSITTNVRYETSSEETGIGADADVFVGAAFNIRYAITDMILYDASSCVVSKDEDLIMGMDSLKTLYTASAGDIKNTIIPDLQELVNLSETEAQKRRYENQINIWQQTLDRNDDLKEAADPDLNFPNRTIFGGAGPVGYTTTSTSTENTFYEMALEINRDVARELEIEIGGVGVSGGVDVNFRMGMGKGETTTSVSTNTIGYVLDDDDVADFYEVQIFNDPVYKTPVFKSENPTTSCPYTGGRKVDNPVLTVNGPIRSGVPADGQAEFTFSVTNGTELPSTNPNSARTYKLDINDDSNPHGAVIVVGSDGVFPLVFDGISKGATKPRDLAIKRVGSPNLSIYAYEGLEFELQPVCGNPADSLITEGKQEVSAYFVSECSGVTLASPAPGWIHDSADGNSLSIHMTTYDKTKLNTITLQYSEAGKNEWENAAMLTTADLNNNSTAGEFYDWFLPDGMEGEFEVRLRLECDNGILYSQRSAGLIDRVGPLRFGLPTPIDDIYDITENDEISIAFNESIACANVSTQLLDAITGDPIAHTFSCNDNVLKLVPNNTLASSAYRVIIDGVEDVHGNVSTEHRWVFITPGFVFDPGCSPIEISNNNLNQDAISQSVYQSLQITSDGTVANGSTVGYKAEQSIDLNSGFTVSQGGELEANIETCDEN